MFNIKEIGKRIEAERKAQRKSRDTLAEEIGTTRQTLAKWEKGNGTSSPSLWDVVRLCDMFSCDFGYIVGEYDCKKRESTDIKKITGLSEEAAEKITSLNSLELRFIDELLKNSDFLTSISQSYCQYRDVNKYYANNGMGLTSFSGNIHIKRENKPDWVLSSTEVVSMLKLAFSHEILSFADRK